jgi:uncharacterized protein YbgA (DUF1722 family)
MITQQRRTKPSKRHIEGLGRIIAKLETWQHTNVPETYADAVNELKHQLMDVLSDMENEQEANA